MESVFPSSKKINLPKEREQIFNQIGVDSVISRYKKVTISKRRKFDL